MEFLNALPPTMKLVLLIVMVLLIIGSLTIGKRR